MRIVDGLAQDPLASPIASAPSLSRRRQRSGKRMKARQRLMLGPPGTGELMLARRLSTIPPDLPLAETIETTRIPNVAGLTGSLFG